MTGAGPGSGRVRGRRGLPRRAALAVLLWMAAPACSDKTAAAGETCARSTECASGLACVEGACSADLTPLVDPSRVPMLTPPQEGEPRLDAAPPAGPDAGATPPPPPPPPADAAVIMPTDAGGG